MCRCLYIQECWGGVGIVQVCYCEKDSAVGMSGRAWRRRGVMRDTGVCKWKGTGVVRGLYVKREAAGVKHWCHGWGEASLLVTEGIRVQVDEGRRDVRGQHTNLSVSPPHCNPSLYLILYLFVLCVLFFLPGCYSHLAN